MDAATFQGSSRVSKLVTLLLLVSGMALSIGLAISLEDLLDGVVLVVTTNVFMFAFGHRSTVWPRLRAQAAMVEVRNPLRQWRISTSAVKAARDGFHLWLELEDGSKVPVWAVQRGGLVLPRSQRDRTYVVANEFNAWLEQTRTSADDESGLLQ